MSIHSPKKGDLLCLAFRGEITSKEITPKMTRRGEIQGMRGGYIITMKGRDICVERADWLAKEVGIAWRSVKWVNSYTMLASRLIGLDSHANSPYPIKVKGKV
jgi:hypothetical protein